MSGGWVGETFAQENPRVVDTGGGSSLMAGGRLRLQGDEKAGSSSGIVFGVEGGVEIWVAVWRRLLIGGEERPEDGDGDVDMDIY